MLRCLVPLALCSMILFSCGNHESNSPSIETTADSVSSPAPELKEEEAAGTGKPDAMAQSGAAAVVSSAATSYSPTVQKKIVHSAEFIIKVKDVATTVNQMEALVKGIGGIVEKSDISNNVYDEKEEIRGDSAYTYNTYRTTGTLNLRVPMPKFDSVIHLIPEMAVFVASRSLSESDESIQYYIAQQKEAANKRSLDDMNAAPGSKSGKVDRAQYRDERRNDQLDRQQEQMEIDRDAYFATITISLSQKERVFIERNINPATPVKTSFWASIGGALSTGANVSQALFIGLVSLWPLWVAASIGILAWRVFRKRRIKTT